LFSCHVEASSVFCSESFGMNYLLISQGVKLIYRTKELEEQQAKRSACFHMMMFHSFLFHFEAKRGVIFLVFFPSSTHFLAFSRSLFGNVWRMNTVRKLLEIFISLSSKSEQKKKDTLWLKAI
jgi:hypothetical protein